MASTNSNSARSLSRAEIYKEPIPSARDIRNRGMSIERPDGQTVPKPPAARKRTVTRSTTTITPRKNSAAKSSYMNGGGSAALKKGKPNPYIREVPKKKKAAKVRQHERLAKFDYPFFTIVIVLLAFGLVMMFSASYETARITYGNSYHYVFRQIGFIGIGLAAMIFLSFVNYRVLANFFIAKAAYFGSLALMGLVIIMGVTQGGAQRWIEIAGVTFQPSEILKLTVIIMMAYLGEKNYEILGDFKRGFVPYVLYLGAACGLTFIQPHLSGTIIIFAIGIILMFVSNCKVTHIMLLIGGLVVVGALGIILLKALGYDYFGARILSWQNPEAEITGDTYQTYQSLLTIGSGGLFGLGLGNSRQKYSYLPMSHNDFIFSVICEELGFVGAMLVIILFVLFIFRGFYIASRARDKFGMLLAVGITSQIGLQALLNIAVVTNSIPNTGISLPFFSYGGTALCMQLAEIGLLLNISRKAAIE